MPVYPGAPQDDDLPAEVPPFEHCLDWVESLHSPSSPVTARLHQRQRWFASRHSVAEYCSDDIAKSQLNNIQICDNQERRFSQY
jgi:hypothetical protein